MNNLSGTDLNLLAVLTAEVISDYYDNDEVAVLSLFFTVLGDSLGTIAGVTQ